MDKVKKKKEQITFFLGAGASYAFGLPLTSQIFPIFWSRLNKNEILRNDQRNLLKQKFFKKLYPGLTQRTRTEDLPTITEVLSLLDNFINNRTIPLRHFSLIELMECRHALEVGIIKVIEEEFFNSDESSPEERRYRKFIKRLERLSENYKVNVITTNYDILVEYGLFSYVFKNKIKKFVRDVDFGVRWRDATQDEALINYNPPENPKYSIFKLHGSTNWLTCELCNQIYINVYGSIHRQVNYSNVRDTNTCHCGHAKLSSVIVSPSIERIVSNAYLRYIWNSALESLRLSNEWIIAGYSLPAEDLHIRSILLRAFEGRDEKPKITVVQKGKLSEPTFRNLFGKVTYMARGMNEFLKTPIK
jgi:NAD-dependent SIR2 family protein deacetylase